MNFKSWLLISEAKKDINLSNPKLTTTIPPLNNGEKTSSERLKKLAYYYGRNGSGYSTTDSNPDIAFLGIWLKNKKSKNPNPYEESDKETWDNLVKLSKTENWIDPVTKQPFRYKDIPNDWREIRPNVKQGKGQKLNIENLEKLAYYYGKKGSGPSREDTNKKIAYLGGWFHNNKSKSLYRESDKETWDRMVTLSKTWDKKKFPYDLPEKWTDIDPDKWQEEGQKLSSANFEKLAYYYGRNGSAPSREDTNKKNVYLGEWLKQKKYKNPNRYEKSDKETWDKMVALSNTLNWVDPDTGKRFKYFPLPNDWREIRPNRPQEKGQKLNSENLEKLAYYYGKKGSPPSSKDSNVKIAYLGGWFHNNKSKSLYQESDKETWDRMVALSKTWDKKKFPYDLPEKWTDIKSDENENNFSYSAKELGKILKKLRLDAIREYQDKECNIITGQCLKFDYSFIYKDQEYFVEYHGGQHYYPVYFGSGQGMTDQEISELAIDAFEIQKKNDLKKYKYCKENNFPLLVIPYWITPDRFKNRILDFIKHDNVFDTLFADSDVPPEYKVKHDKIFYKTECFATNGFNRTVNCKELDVKPTFEQFLINKNFINI